MNVTTPASTATPHTAERRIRPVLLWFAALGGAVAWAVHLLLAWSALELGCLGSSAGEAQQRVNSVGTPLLTYVAGVTGVPLLVAIAATVAALVLRSRLSGLHLDDLAYERTKLMITVGIVLNLMSVAALIGDGIALLVLEPCG